MPSFDPVREFLEGPFRHVAVDEEAHEALSAGDLAHLRPFRVGRERRDAVHLRLDLVERAVDVRPGLELGNDRRESLGGHRGYTVEALHAANLFLDPADDRFLDLFRRGARVGDEDLHAVQGDVGDHLLHETERRVQAADEQDEHDDVDRGAVSRHVGDRAAPGAMAHASYLCRRRGRPNGYGSNPSSRRVRPANTQPRGPNASISRAASSSNSWTRPRACFRESTCRIEHLSKSSSSMSSTTWKASP